MNIKITRSTRVLENLTKKIRALSKANVSSGYFETSGIHEESGMTYASLMNLQETGSNFGGVNIPARNLRETTLYSLRDRNLWEGAIWNYLNGKSLLDNSLNKIGMEITSTAQDLFGDAGVFTDNALLTIKLKGGKNTPLVDSGDLRDAWTWKVTLT